MATEHFPSVVKCRLLLGSRLLSKLSISIDLHWEVSGFQPRLSAVRGYEGSGGCLVLIPWDFSVLMDEQRTTPKDECISTMGYEHLITLVLELIKCGYIVT